MFDKYLRILIICSCIFGVSGVLLISFLYDSDVKTPSELLSFPPNDRIYYVFGQVKNIKENSNVLFFEICDFSDCLSCVYFNPTKQIIFSMTNNQEITIKAKYSYYKNEPELIVFSFLEYKG